MFRKVNKNTAADSSLFLKATLHIKAMSNSPLKTQDTVPVTSLIAVTQTALGFGAGLLLAGTMRRSVQKVTAVAMLTVGVISTVPLVVDLVAKYLNKPGSERGMRKRLASIRDDSGITDDAEVF
jgi:ABC-type amino acid transport system permease subunit